MLGVSSLSISAATAVVGGSNSSNSGQLQLSWLSGVRCSGTELRLHDCPYDSLGSVDCNSGQYAAVRCTGTTCDDGAIRLRGEGGGGEGGDGVTQGRVEICQRNVWGTVCEDGWGVEDARVACRQLGLPTSGSLRKFS